jgi:hypothetical protein
MDIKGLVFQITPFYNKYKANIMIGSDALCLMWQIGALLDAYIKEKDIIPNNLYRKIYGGSEGSDNVQKKGYISREFLSRCYRIKNIFTDENEIKNIFPNLKSFNLFREAMPFFDNPIYNSKRKEMEDFLNTKEASLDKIRARLKEVNPKSNSRTQRLHELEGEKSIFIDFYNKIFNLSKVDKDTLFSLLEKERIDQDLILTIGNATRALTIDGLKFPSLENKEEQVDINSLWFSYIEMLKEFSNESNAIKIRRFRKLIQAKRIAKLADYLYLLARRI